MTLIIEQLLPILRIKNKGKSPYFPNNIKFKSIYFVTHNVREPRPLGCGGCHN